MREDFSKNLRLLCSYYRSIAEVCRKIPINRSQFNKYLSGSSMPSNFILRQICDFFGVEEYEIFLPHEQFASILQVRPKAVSQSGLERYLPAIEGLRDQSSERLQKYQGFYYETYYSMAFPGQILRNLVSIQVSEEGAHYQRIERVRPPDGRTRLCRSRYRGCVFFLIDRIFMVDYEALTENEMTQTILYPTYKSQIDLLAGLKLGVSASDIREPACARVIYEYLGESINLRAALKRCGLYSHDSEEVDEKISRHISNAGENTDNLFLARHL